MIMSSSDIIEISEINFDSLNDSFNGSSSSSSSSKKTNFGGGIELLMNDTKRSDKSGGSGIDVEDLNNLEKELNNLVDIEPISHSFSSSLFGNDSNNSSSFEDKPNVKFMDSPSVGGRTAEIGQDSKTWDGYGKFNNIPFNPDKSMNSMPQMTKEELLREKFKFIRKLESLEKKGVELTKKYTMESSLLEMQGEYEMIMEEKAMKNSVKFQGNMMMAVINGMEFLNSRFDPFDIKLDGWGDQINENISDYDEIFGELYDKYKSKASMSPELKLLFQLGGSAMMVHMTNTMFKTAMPGMDDIFRQNPDLMRHFQSAAVSSMGESNPGFAGFMNNVANSDPHSNNGFSNGRGPPAPLATQGPNSVPVPTSRAGNNNSAAKSVFMSPNNEQSQSQSQSQSQQRRPEMRGPSDISNILSGLKTKTIDIKESPVNDFENNDNSTISISDLKDLQDNGINLPKKSKRRQKSDKNTVSLDF
jgi:hypothetical protein